MKNSGWGAKLGAAACGVAFSLCAHVAAAQSFDSGAAADDSLGNHQKNIRLDAGARTQFVKSRALDAFATNDVIAQLSLGASLDFWARDRLSLAAGELYTGPSSLRLAAVFGAKIDAERAHATAARLLTFMNETLTGRAFLLGAEPTIADIAMYTYTAHAPEGGVSLEPYPSVRAWLANVEAVPGFVAMRRVPAKA